MGTRKQPERVRNETRRKVVKAAYLAPVIMTLPATPQYAKAGSIKPEDGGLLPKLPIDTNIKL